jgi:hypothetical protein
MGEVERLDVGQGRDVLTTQHDPIGESPLDDTDPGGGEHVVEDVETNHM